jgi:hypothetical protein
MDPNLYLFFHKHRSDYWREICVVYLCIVLCHISLPKKQINDHCLPYSNKMHKIIETIFVSEICKTRNHYSCELPLSRWKKDCGRVADAAIYYC